MSDEKKGYLTLEEASEFCSIPVESLRKFVKGRDDTVPKLPAVKPGKRVLISKKDLEVWLKKFPAA